MTTPTPEPTNETVEKKIKGAIEKVLIDLLTDKKGFDHLSTALEDLTQAENDLFDLFSEERKRAQIEILEKALELVKIQIKKTGQEDLVTFILSMRLIIAYTEGIASKEEFDGYFTNPSV